MNDSRKHIGPYTVDGEIGRGVIGVVYRATDTRHGRAVAIKALPEGVAGDRDRLARFEREAKLLASLNHQNIATIFGLEEQDGERYLVMELVEGDTLAELIASGPMAIDDALEVAMQIADGLEAAHERGVVHRDLKPANIMVASSGRVKILDFGLATAIQPEAVGQALDDSPTLTAQMTAAGTLLGTAAYMSPEQARGRAVDTRTDIWAFGVVLWEMLVGRPLVGGKSTGDALAAILRDTPDWNLLPSDLPPGVGRLLRRCLRRDPAKRLRHIGDARIELEEAAEEIPSSVALVFPEFWPNGGGIEKTWTLTTDVCRHLDRETLDPSVIGDKLSYLDNERESDVLMVCLSGLGFDHSLFGEILRRSPYRSIVVTLLGFEKSRARRVSLPIADHLTILRLFLESVLEDLTPATTVLTGMSSGADMALRMVSEGGVGKSHIDGILALSPNISLETCFFTRRITEIDDDKDETILDLARRVAGGINTPREWVQVTPYLVELVRKFHTDVSPLRNHSQDILAPFLAAGEFPVAGWYRKAREAGLGVRMVFAGDEKGERQAIQGLMLAHVDHQVLGPDFADADIVLEPETLHMGLIATDLVEKHLEDLLRPLRTTGRAEGRRP